MAAPVADAALRSALVAATAWLGTQVLAVDMPKIELPKISLPKVEMPKVSLPKVSLPSLPGQKKKDAAAKPEPPAARVVDRTNVRVRAANIGVASPDAPTLAELTGKQSQDTIAAGDGWKRFPSRRMPGANMQGWKDIAKEITPKI